MTGIYYKNTNFFRLFELMVYVKRIVIYLMYRMLICVYTIDK